MPSSIWLSRGTSSTAVLRPAAEVDALGEAQQGCSVKTSMPGPPAMLRTSQRNTTGRSALMKRRLARRSQLRGRATFVMTATACALLLTAASATAQVIKTIPVGRAPSGIRFDPVNGKVYVATRLDGAVNVIAG